jgi:pimeloyl-ACP methyl ester carboxylesterase
MGRGALARIAALVTGRPPHSSQRMISSSPLRSMPEVDPFNFVSRVRIPVIMLNGRYDHYFPVETSQRPMFVLLGTPAADKKWVVYDGGHFVPRDQLVKETLAWLDRYLGDVK